MKKKILIFCGVEYIVPEPFVFLKKELTEYPSRCGAGEGIGDKLVPEFIGGMKCSHICDVHDFWWAICDATWLAFLRGNMAFGYNLAVYLGTREGNWRTKAWRLVKGAAYVAAVSTFGWKIFKKLKGIK